VLTPVFTITNAPHSLALLLPLNAWRSKFVVNGIAFVIVGTWCECAKRLTLCRDCPHQRDHGGTHGQEVVTTLADGTPSILRLKDVFHFSNVPGRGSGEAVCQFRALKTFVD
jgi:hypothetical protein